MIRDFTPRLYQETILASSARANTLIVLPTGLGKTNVFLMLAAQRLQQYPGSKVLLLGPTRPLIDQYRSVFERHFNIDAKKLVTLTGQVTPEKREELWKNGSVIFSTPQGLENDLLSKRIDLKDVSLLGFDEAHRAVGDYAYVFIAKRYQEAATYPRIVGLTASPGNDVQTITEVCTNLQIENIEVRTEDDPDVRPYIQQVDVEWVSVILPESFAKIRGFVISLLKRRAGELRGLLPGETRISESISRKDLLGLQGAVQGRIASGERDFSLMRAMSILAEFMKAQHALELLESQGIVSLHTYIARLEEQARSTKVKAVRNLVVDPDFKSVRYLTAELLEKKVEHPKVARLIEDVTKAGPTAKVMIFTQYRDTAGMIREQLAKAGVSGELFVGQMKKGETGMSQKEQKRMLDRFRAGEFRALISTSIGEEGLDVPSVDMVIFYEPVPSAIRAIQRRGRTGRQDKGRVMVLIAKGTRDEAYRWSAHHKEKLMVRTLRSLRSAPIRMPQQKTVAQFDEANKGLRILIDFREKGSGVVKQLMENGVDVQMRQLAVGDYQCSARACVELKTVEDFVDSIIDGRLLVQLKDLQGVIERPVVLVVGESDIYSVRRVHANAINGMLATIAVGYGIPVVRVKNDREAAQFIIAVLKREQEAGGAEFSAHASKRVRSLRDEQEYVVSALPGIGPSVAKPLLRKFGSVKGIINASEKELQEVDLVGKKKSGDIKRVTDSPYEE